ncbi:hypothetical protein ACFL6U_04040 [Planctomycetota bacterium]
MVCFILLRVVGCTFNVCYKFILCLYAYGVYAYFPSTTHDFELEAHKRTIVNIAYKQMGVGGDNSWGNPVMDKYQIKPGSYSYGFILEPKTTPRP